VNLRIATLTVGLATASSTIVASAAPRSPSDVILKTASVDLTANTAVLELYRCSANGATVRYVTDEEASS
jgi:hypothetical protein